MMSPTMSYTVIIKMVLGAHLACIRARASIRDPASIRTIDLDLRPVLETRLVYEVLRYNKHTCIPDNSFAKMLIKHFLK